MIGDPDGNRAVMWDIPTDPRTLGDVRNKIRRTLNTWRLDDPAALADDIVLAITEVLSNAVLYGAPPIRLTVRLAGEILSAEVTDHGAGLPAHTPLDDESEHGRGLTIMAALSDEWGILPDRLSGGKTVWFRKKCPRTRDEAHQAHG